MSRRTCTPSASAANHPRSFPAVDPTNAMRLPSGDHTGFSIEWLAATVNGGPPICGIAYRRAAALSSVPAYAIDSPSGDHASPPGS
jgi:hypothetical protein